MSENTGRRRCGGSGKVKVSSDVGTPGSPRASGFNCPGCPDCQCPTCEGAPEKPWLRIHRGYQVKAHFTDEEVGKWHDIATEDYEHFRCPDPCHGQVAMMESDSCFSCGHPSEAHDPEGCRDCHSRGHICREFTTRAMAKGRHDWECNDPICQAFERGLNEGRAQERERMIGRLQAERGKSHDRERARRLLLDVIDKLREKVGALETAVDSLASDKDTRWR